MSYISDMIIAESMDNVDEVEIAISESNDCIDIVMGNAPVEELSDEEIDAELAELSDELDGDDIGELIDDLE